MRRTSLLLMVVLLVSAGCASSKQDSRAENVDFDARLANTVFFGGGNVASAPVEVLFSNRGTEPIRVRRIRLETPTMTQYSLDLLDRSFNELVEPGKSVVLTLFATARTTIRDPREPLTMRFTVEYEDSKGRFREIYTR